MSPDNRTLWWRWCVVRAAPFDSIAIRVVAARYRNVPRNEIFVRFVPFSGVPRASRRPDFPRTFRLCRRLSPTRLRSADNNAAISRATPPPPTPFRVSTSPKRRGIPLQYRRVILSWPAPLRFISCVLRDIRVAVRLHNVFSVARVGAPVVPVSIEHPVLAPH